MKKIIFPLLFTFMFQNAQSDPSDFLRKTRQFIEKSQDFIEKSKEKSREAKENLENFIERSKETSTQLKENFLEWKKNIKQQIEEGREKLREVKSPEIEIRYFEIPKTATSKRYIHEGKFLIDIFNSSYETKCLESILDYDPTTKTLSAGFYTTGWNIEGIFYKRPFSKTEKNLLEAYTHIKEVTLYLLSDKPIDIVKLENYGYFGDIEDGPSMTVLKLKKDGDLVDYTETVEFQLLLQLLKNKEDVAKISETILKYGGHPFVGRIVREGINRGFPVIEENLKKEMEEEERREEKLKKELQNITGMENFIRIPMRYEKSFVGKRITAYEFFLKIKNKEKTSAYAIYVVSFKWPFFSFEIENTCKGVGFYKFEIE